MGKWRIVFSFVFLTGVVAWAAFTPPYASLWFRLHERHLEPSGQASWQVREREQKAEQERQRLVDEEAARVAAAKKQEEERDRQRQEAADRNTRLAAAETNRDRLVVAIFERNNDIRIIAGKDEVGGRNAIAAMKVIEARLDHYRPDTMEKLGFSIADVMRGEPCRRAANPLASALDSSIDTVRYLFLCAYRYSRQEGDLMTRATHVLYLNRTSVHNAGDINGTRLALASLVRAIWLERAPGAGRGLPADDMEGVKALFRSEASSFVTREVIDSLSVAELDQLRLAILPDLRRHGQLTAELVGLCDDLDRANSAIDEMLAHAPESPEMPEIAEAVRSPLQLWQLADSGKADPSEHDWQDQVSRKTSSPLSSAKSICQPY